MEKNNIQITVSVYLQVEHTHKEAKSKKDGNINSQVNTNMKKARMIMLLDKGKFQSKEKKNPKHLCI